MTYVVLNYFAQKSVPRLSSDVKGSAESSTDFGSVESSTDFGSVETSTDFVSVENAGSVNPDMNVLTPS